MKITFRPITEADKPFLCELYASTRLDELAATGWSDEEKQNFLTMQFEAQHSHYMTHYPEANFDIILQAEQSIGRLYLDKWEDEHRLIDIALLPEYRNKGLGTKLMKEILAEAAAEAKAVRIHVEHFNPALRLYERLGFTKLEDKGVYYFMEWHNANT